MGLRHIILPALSVLAIAPGIAFAQSAKSQISAPAAVNLLPADTVGVMLINTREQAWSELSRFGLFPADFSFPAPLFPLNATVDFHTYIQPWLGDHIAIAYLSMPDADKTPLSSSLLIAPIKDASKIPAFLDQVKASREDAVTERDYQGITILEWIATSTPAAEEEMPTEEEPQASRSPRMRQLATRNQKVLTTAAAQTKQAPEKPGIQDKPDAAPAEIPEEPPEEVPEEPTEEMPEEPVTEVPFSGLAIAVLPNGYLVSATNAKPIEQLIDAQSSGERLIDKLSFKRTVENPNFGRSLLVGYGNYAQIFKAAATFNENELKALPVPLPFPVPQPDANLVTLLNNAYDNIEGYLWAQPEGIRMQVNVGLKQPIPEPLLQAMNTPNQIMERLPEVSYLAGNGKDLATIWRLVIAGVESQPKLKPGLERFRKYSQQYTGVDDRDIFPWMNGEYVSFLYPTKQGWIPAIFPEIDLGVGMAFQTRDRPAAEAAMNKLDRFIQSRPKPPIKVAARQLKGQPVTSWEVLDNKQQTQSFLSRNWVSDDTLMVLTGTGATAELSPQPLRSLTQSKNFQNAIAPLPLTNTGYFYVNMGATLSFVNNTVLPKIFGKELANDPQFNEYKAIIGSIRSLSSTTSIVSNQAQTDGFLALATTRTQPISASELLDLGQQKMDKGQTDWAIANFSRALQLEPNNAQAYYQRGAARYDQGDRSGALADLSQAVQFDPQNGDAYYLRGLTKGQMFDYSGANQDYTRALQLQPNNAEMYGQRSEARFFLEDFQGAIADATQSINLDPMRSSAYNMRCYTRARGLEDFKTALPDCNKAVNLAEKEEGLPAFLASRCYVRANLSDQKALEDCELAVESNPEYEGYPEFLEDRGLAKVALGDKSGGLSDLQQALDLTPPEDKVSVARLEKLVRSLQQ